MGRMGVGTHIYGYVCSAKKGMHMCQGAIIRDVQGRCSWSMRELTLTQLSEFEQLRVYISIFICDIQM